ncbi:hypothetical protein YQE_00518, partial [Dendroctonus ponderosae]
MEPTCDDSNQQGKGYNSNVVPTEQMKPNECEEQTPAHQECHQAGNDVCLHSVGVCGRNLPETASGHRKKLLRMAIYAPWFVRNSQIYRDLEWEPLRDFLQRKAASTFEKAENHPLAELRNAVDYSPEDAGLRKKRSRHQMAQQGNSRNLFMLDNVDLETWRNVQWFQHDGAPPHNFSQVRNHLDVTFPGAWIGRNGPILWPPRSPDLSPLDFFWCGAVKNTVYT